MKQLYLAMLLLVAGCDRAEAPATAAPAEAGAPAVEVVPVTSARLETTARLPAELAPYEWVALYPRVTGFLDEITVDRGARVRRGQVLVRLSAPELTSQRAEAESKLAASRSTMERLHAAAATPGAVARHEVEIAEDAVKADEDRVRSLRTLEGYLVVRAPFDGVVTERNVHPGALVGPPSGAGATPMLRVQSVQRLRLTVAVPEADAGTIAVGARAAFEVRAWPGTRFSGIIRRVSGAVDPRTRTMPVELDVDNADGKLAPGMFAEVSWPVRREAPSLFVPPTAIAQTTEKTYVDRVRDGTVEQVPVTRGMTGKDRVEVFGALAPGDLVMARASEEYKSGTKIAPKQPPPDGGAAR